MTTEKQTAANRGNAKMSTGPVTALGKTVSSRNALRHGILAQTEILVSRGENAENLETLRAALYRDLRPEGDLEELLLDRFVALVWRLRRLHAAEVGLFEDAEESLSSLPSFSPRGSSPARNAETKAAGWAFVFHPSVEGLTTLSRYEATIERGLFRTLHEIQRLQAAREGNGGPPPLALDLEVGGFA